jgi:hypothetical protein
MLISIGKLGAVWARVSGCNRKLGGHARMSGFLNERWRVSVVLNGDEKRLTPLLRTVFINTQAAKTKQNRSCHVEFHSRQQTEER